MSLRNKTVYSLVHKQSLDEQVTNLARLTDFTDAAYYLFINDDTSDETEASATASVWLILCASLVCMLFSINY